MMVVLCFSMLSVMILPMSKEENNMVEVVGVIYMVVVVDINHEVDIW